MKKLTLTFICLLLAVPCQGTEYTTVEDFESYVGTIDLQGVWSVTKKTHSLWYIASYREEAQDSNQSMRLVYKLKSAFHTGDPNYAEAYRTAPFADFTDGGLAKAISLWYRSETPPLAQGCTTFEFGDVYVTLEDSSGGDTDTVRLSDAGEDPCINAEWHEWNIDLADFNNPDLDITNINRIYLGVGDGSNIGVGYVYFDEIRLYPARCLPSLLKPDGDINNDCIVDFNDVEIMSRDWLDSDFITIGWDGLLDPDAFLPPGGWVSDPCRGNCLRFDGHEDTYDDSNDWVDVPDYALGNFQNRTIAVWVKNNDPDQEDLWRVRIFSSHSDYIVALSIGATGTREGRLEGQVEDCKMTRIPDSDLPVGEWHHAALVIGNKSGDEYVYCELYLDGVHIADNENPGGPGSSPSDEIPRHKGPCLRGANIGSYNDGERCFIQATLDDFRIYDYNMPTQDVNDIYMLERDGSTDSYKDPNLIIWYKFDETAGFIAEDSGRRSIGPCYWPLDSPANLYREPPTIPLVIPPPVDIVNFKDYAVLADDWLVEKLWPDID